MAKMTDLEKFVEELKAEEEALGLKSFGIMESMEQMDKSDTTRYDVVMIPRKPKARDKITYTKKEDTL